MCLPLVGVLRWARITAPAAMARRPKSIRSRGHCPCTWQGDVENAFSDNALQFWVFTHGCHSSCRVGYVLCVHFLITHYEPISRIYVFAHASMIHCFFIVFFLDLTWEHFLNEVSVHDHCICNWFHFYFSFLTPSLLRMVLAPTKCCARSL